MNHSIEVIARGLLIRNQHLLVCYGAKGDYYYLPGGHVEFYETCEQALQREWTEELGCSCTIKMFLRHFEEFFVDACNVRHHEYSFLYRVECESLDINQPLPHMEENVLFKWLPLSKIKSSVLYPQTLAHYIEDNQLLS